jgi:HD superfamily phosphohydrolase YqeK
METKIKQRILEILKDTKREGVDEICKFLEDSDYFTAPASSKLDYHNCHKGGLAKHSLEVYDCMVKLNQDYKLGFKEDSIALVGLLHDFCKVNQYEENLLKNGKQSEKIPYKVNDEFPLGHGEKSAILLLRQGLMLHPDEILGIRWHMNAFDDIGHYKAGGKWNDLSILCFIADYFTSRLLKPAEEDDGTKEKEENEN